MSNDEGIIGPKEYERMLRGYGLTLPDDPGQHPFMGSLGANVFLLNRALTPDERLRLMRFSDPNYVYPWLERRRVQRAIILAVAIAEAVAVAAWFARWWP